MDKASNKKNSVELPPDAQRVVYETIERVRHPEIGFQQTEAFWETVTQTCHILGTAVLLCLACFMSYSVYQKDKQYVIEKEGFYRPSVLAVDVVEDTGEEFEKSLEEMQKAIKRRTALNRIQAHLLSREVSETGPMTDDEARAMLMRAGYLPSEIDATVIERVKQKGEHIGEMASPEKIDQDVNFAKYVAEDIVRDEVESFAHKLRLLTVVGGYLFKRVSDEDQ